ncbi:hypothetical protein FKG94_10770 [Exilibacterium tricleocarpae]|uniref:Uncharacterized protein n=1 Tax=Exilibacterium tricleocarpae TaxID=2591008 RepID=A0A545TSE9_9GAMM|nr:hypothetical protein [Exilibacterium tricleocarpae]TQV80142.1 hypothetical protein FKG94_10770 [Exilibacterium tricleocarpae]
MSAAASAAPAIDDSRLWLPKSYEHYFPKLRKAARTAAQTERCESVLQGQLHRERSRPDHPVYRITCRDSERISYTVVIDGLTYRDLTPPRQRRQQHTPAQLEALRHEQYWEICRRELDQRTKRMLALVWLTDTMPQPDQSVPLQDVFTVDFDAQNIQKQRLRYRALCSFVRIEETEEEQQRMRRQGELIPAFEYQVKITPRR